VAKPSLIALAGDTTSVHDPLKNRWTLREPTRDDKNGDIVGWLEEHADVRSG